MDRWGVGKRGALPAIPPHPPKARLLIPPTSDYLKRLYQQRLLIRLRPPRGLPGFAA
jgi:hypothetical protein